MTGIYFRVERNGQWQSLDLAELTTAEAKSVLAVFDKDALIRTVLALVKEVHDE
jgi:hypothetical protein